MESALEGRGPLRYGPPVPEPGLPVVPELAAVLARAAERPHAEPPAAAPPSWRQPRGTGRGADSPPTRPCSPPPPARPPCSSP